MQRRDALTVATPIVAASTEPEITWLNQSKIRRDGATQLRIKIDQSAVHRYAERWASGSVPPNVTVFYDGTDYWLGDGFHRVAAAIEKEKLLALNDLTHAINQDPIVPCDVRAGTRRDARLHAAMANRDHGVAMTAEDIRNAIDVMLRDDEWVAWSDREIARHIGCSPTTVGKRRSILATEIQAAQVQAPLSPTVHVDSGATSLASTPATQTRTYERNGKVQTMNVGGLQKKEEPPELPLATLDEVIAAIWLIIKYRAGIRKDNQTYLNLLIPMKLKDMSMSSLPISKRISQEAFDTARETVTNEIQGRIENERKTAEKAAKFAPKTEPQVTVDELNRITGVCVMLLGEMPAIAHLTGRHFADPLAQAIKDVISVLNQKQNSRGVDSDRLPNL